MEEQQHKYFLRIPLDLLLSREISGSAVLVYAALCDLADSIGIAEIEQEQLAQAVGMSRRQVQALIQQLVSAKLITVERTGRASCYMIWDKQATTGKDWSAIRAEIKRRRKGA